MNIGNISGCIDVIGEDLLGQAEVTILLRDAY